LGGGKRLGGRKWGKKEVVGRERGKRLSYRLGRGKKLNWRKCGKRKEAQVVNWEEERRKDVGRG
jgi:hypothetical protein